MSTLIALLCNDPERVECALFPARQALHSRAARDGSGWGLGFAQAGDVLLQKRPRAESTDIDFFGVAKSLRADAIVARAGLDEDARTSADNADPFRFRSWLFGSVGSVKNFEAARERLLASVPDFLRRNVRGRTPSEHLFHLFLAFLHDAGLLDSPSAPPRSVSRALTESAAFVDRLLEPRGDGPLKLATVATNGRCLVAETRSHPMQYLQIDGISDCTVCRQKHDLDGTDRRFAHEGLRAVILEASDDGGLRPGWRAVPPTGGLIVGADHLAQPWSGTASAV